MEPLPLLLEEHIETTEKIFEEANHQLNLLIRRIEYTRHRFMLASRDKKRPFRYTLKMDLIVLQGVYHRIYRYAYLLANILDELRRMAGYTVIQQISNTIPDNI